MEFPQNIFNGVVSEEYLSLLLHSSLPAAMITEQNTYTHTLPLHIHAHSTFIEFTSKNFDPHGWVKRVDLWTELYTLRPHGMRHGPRNNATIV